jgi:hypothetical protein
MEEKADFLKELDKNIESTNAQNTDEGTSATEIIKETKSEQDVQDKQATPGTSQIEITQQPLSKEVSKVTSSFLGITTFALEVILFLCAFTISTPAITKAVLYGQGGYTLIGILLQIAIFVCFVGAYQDSFGKKTKF